MTLATARLAQSAERKALNLVVVGSSPTVGVSFVVVSQVDLSSFVDMRCSCAAGLVTDDALALQVVSVLRDFF